MKGAAEAAPQALVPRSVVVAAAFASTVLAPIFTAVVPAVTVMIMVEAARWANEVTPATVKIIRHKKFSFFFYCIICRKKGDVTEKWNNLNHDKT